MQLAPPPSVLRRIHTLLQFSRLNSKATGNLAVVSRHSYITPWAECLTRAGSRVHKGKKEEEPTFQRYYNKNGLPRLLPRLLTVFYFVEVILFFFFSPHCRIMHSFNLDNQWKQRNALISATSMYTGRTWFVCRLKSEHYYLHSSNKFND